MFNLLDSNKNANILLAGILSLFIGVGVARFAFTTMLPPMLEDFLSVTNAGLFASINYVGYLSGAVFSIFIKDVNSKVKYFRLGLALSVLTTLILATTTDETLWFASRIIAGFGSAMVLIVGGALVMVKLNLADKTKAMGIHFSGIGFSVALSELIAQYVLQDGSWPDAWMALALSAFVLSFYCIHILSFDKEQEAYKVQHALSRDIFSPYVLLLIAAYFTAGVTMVVQSTFFPDIINSLAGLKGSGSLGWLLVGLAGIPSAIIWMRLAYRYGSVNMIILAFVLQIIGILIPVLSNDLGLNLLSGVLFGSTFIGHVALFMHYGGKLAGANPVVLMGAMTSAYGVGQVSAPLYSVGLYEHFSSYNPALLVTATIAILGIVLLLIAKKIHHQYES